MNRRRLIATWGWVVGVIALIALGTLARAPMPPGAPGGRMFPRVPAPPPDWPSALYILGVGSARWYLILLVAPLLIAASRRMRWSTLSRAAILSLWTATLVVVVVVAGTIEYSVVYWGAASRPPFVYAAAAALPAQLAAWIAVITAVAALEARRHTLVLREESKELRAVIAEQRLTALTRQLEPHFLFNTLQSISTLIHRDAAKADQALAKLSDLLRDLLRHRDRVMISLRDEVRYCETYLDLSRLRYGERLSTRITADESLFDAAVPLFLLQPLLENALAHGVGAADRPAAIDVVVERGGDRLIIEVMDDGVGYSAEDVRPNGSGISNVRKRLEAAFGSDQHLAITRRQPTGTIVHLDMPLTAAPPPP